MLMQLITAEIKTHAQAVILDEAAMVNKLKHKIDDYDEQRLADAKQEITKLRRRMQELETLTAKLYEDKCSDAVSESTFVVRSWTESIRKYSDVTELDRAIIDELIDHIEIGERTVIDGQRRQDIKVFYRFVGLVE